MGKSITVDIREVKDHPDIPNVRSTLPKKDITELKNSIFERGLKTPILVFKQKGIYYLISGFRRREALLQLHVEHPRKDEFIHVQANAIEYDDDDFVKEALFDNLIENIQRKDVSGYDLSERIKMLIDKGIKKDEISKKISKSLTWVNETLRFLEDATDEVKTEAKAGTISLDEAKKIAKLKKEQQGTIAKGLAQINKSGDKQTKKKFKQTLDEATRVRSHRMPSKIKIRFTRNVLFELMKILTQMDDRDKILVKSCFTTLEWILGNTTKGLNFDVYLKKYNITIDKQGNAIDPSKLNDSNKADMKPGETENSDDVEIPEGEG